jgi:cell division septation protein DedD
MADDKNKDLDPEEENQDPLEDDDFGLPDLEYDELDDDDFEDEFDSPSGESESDESFEVDAELDDLDDSFEEEEAEEELDEALTVDDTFGDLDDEAFEDTDLDDLEGMEADLDDDDIDISDEELQKELEELESEDLDFGDLDDIESEGESEEEGFYEQESFEEFSEDNDNVLDSVFGADDEVTNTTGGYEPTETQRTGPKKDLTAKQKAANQYAASYASQASSGKGNFAKIVIIGTVVILIIAASLAYFNGMFGEGEKEVAKTETPKRQPPKETKPKEEKPAVAQSEGETKKEAAKQTSKPVEQPVAKPSPTQAGTVNQLEQRTGKAYVVIASFVDGDMALDHANDLAGKGKSPYIIPPFNNGLYYRVAIAEFPTFADASQNIGRYKEEFGQDIWTLRY